MTIVRGIAPGTVSGVSFGSIERWVEEGVFFLEGGWTLIGTQRKGLVVHQEIAMHRLGSFGLY